MKKNLRNECPVRTGMKRVVGTVAITLAALGFGLARAETNAPAVPPATGTNAVSAVESLDLLNLSDTDLAGLSVPELYELQARFNRETKDAGYVIVELKKETVKLQMDARVNNPDVKALDTKILELRKQIQDVIESIPAIKEKQDQVKETEKKMIELSKAKMKVLTFINAIGAAPASPERPEGN